MPSVNSLTRRRLLFGLSASGMIAIAGCSDGDNSQDDIKDSDGDGVIDSEDYAPQDPEVQEKSDIQSGGNSPSTETETPTETATPTETGTPTETEESDKRQALVAYRAGNELLQSANDWHDEASTEYGDEEYEQAEQAYQNAAEASLEAEKQFDRAATLADFADRQEAVQIAETARAYMNDIFVPFSDTAKAAAIAQQRGEPERAERYVEEAQEYIEEAENRQNNGNDVAETIEFREALDLD